MDYMTAIAANLQAVRTRIAAAERESGRIAANDHCAVSLLAVSKTWPAAAIREAWQAGQRAFAESYLQEALDKLEGLRDLPIEWHFIGPLQSNKTRAVAENFAWLHTIDRAKIAQRLSEQRPSELPPLNVCLQINVSGEASKSGVAPGEVAELARAVAGLPRLALRGLMCIPEATDNVGLQRSRFAQMRELLHVLNAELGLSMDTLSMGMSDDLESAVAEGATMVRVGTAIFGVRA
jgi:pyridoxal phosphate enzyme (YggS family)